MTDEPTESCGYPSPPPHSRIPTTVEDLWRYAFIATTEDEANTQAIRQWEPFAGTVIEVDRLSGKHPDSDYYDELFLAEPVSVEVHDLNIEGGWDGWVLYPEWRVSFVDSDTQLKFTEGTTPCRAGDFEDPYYGPLGIGTEDGTNPDRSLRIYLEPSS